VSTKGKGGLDDLALVLLDEAVLGVLLHHRREILFGQLRVLFAFEEPTGGERLKKRKDQTERIEEDDEKRKRVDGKRGGSAGDLAGDLLGNGFAEKVEDQGQDDRGDEGVPNLG
jgi:hypothetical protein